MKYMLDTHVIDFLFDHKIEVYLPEDTELFVTNVQVSEILNVPDVERRKRLVDTLQSIPHSELVVSSPVWDDALHWNDEVAWLDEPSPEYAAIIGESNKNRDTLIAEAANNHKMVLVTSDGDCRRRAKRIGVVVISPSVFLESLQTQYVHLTFFPCYFREGGRPHGTIKDCEEAGPA